MNTWLDISKDSDFSIFNLPFGIFSKKKSKPSVGCRIGEWVIDLELARKLGLLEIPRNIFNQNSLNPFIGLGRKRCNEVRLQIQEWLSVENSPLKRHFYALFHKIDELNLHMPVKVGDYTDFYSSIEHATNAGKIFRPDNPLYPNWKHIPIAYHGRASSIVVSGTDIHRPMGQFKPADSASPIYGYTKELDFELEIGAIIGRNSQQGEQIKVADAENYVFGFVLFNDWSARDIQRWETLPLGPFLGKNFASSISPWVVMIDALEDFRVNGPIQDPTPLPYLQVDGARNFDIKLAVRLNESTICKTNFKYMYWNIAQQVAHHTVNGCNLKIGDILASGTISGSEANSYGSLLELNWAGKNTISLNDGQTRTYLENGDRVSMHGFCEKDGKRVGFGEVFGKIV
ncbi:fumarylacetoacetase [Emticicia oligotrophica DSM 17448]|uniref:fumarylacetoacetase n=1 Tax=Emticicia oligotrophica (strain DSM 17448 / CIP 109782 / MTCC 6937 / GPTSA100-15) TaxID=929562 RepID=A0ABM5N5K8_EMTOG|nr:fumarylacetoacetase [Emticicia oligotrophica]AFK04769.1 fumarylacetoacetase [Emticicia oligotrophica DSM 17448]